jgi:hypothetical protein
VAYTSFSIAVMAETTFIMRVIISIDLLDFHRNRKHETGQYSAGFSRGIVPPQSVQRKSFISLSENGLVGRRSKMPFHISWVPLPESAAEWEKTCNHAEGRFPGSIRVPGLLQSHVHLGWGEPNCNVTCGELGVRSFKLQGTISLE